MKRIALFVAAFAVTMGAAWAADEITTQIYIKASKGYTELSRSPGTLQTTWNGSKIYGPVVYSLTTSYTSLGRGQLATNGLCYMRHVGTSNVVDVSFDAGTNAHLRLKSGEFFLFRLNPTLTITGVQIKSDVTADCEVSLIED